MGEVAARPQGPNLHDALRAYGCLEELMEGLDRAQQRADTLCAGLRVKLSRFLEMVNEHVKSLEEKADGSGSESEQEAAREDPATMKSKASERKKGKRFLQQQRRMSRDAKYGAESLL